MSPPSLPLRADGVQARQKLLQAALACFAEQGYAKTSTRQIAQLAGVNLAAINYYFGSKSDLYRAVFTQTCQIASNVGQAGGLQAAQAFLPSELPTGTTLLSVLQTYYRTALQPLKQSELARLSMRLHFRELLEPSGMLQEFIDNLVRPVHEALNTLLAGQLGLAQVDEDVSRLSLAIQGMEAFLFMAQDGIKQLTPKLLASPEAIDTLAERLAIYALGMVEAEKIRRQAEAR
jgi:AcrR family transcriptional regulator